MANPRYSDRSSAPAWTTHESHASIERIAWTDDDDNAGINQKKTFFAWYWCFKCCIIGSLLAGIGLAVVLTFWLTSKTTATETLISTTSTPTSTTSTSTTSTTSTISTSTATTTTGTPCACNYCGYYGYYYLSGIYYGCTITTYSNSTSCYYNGIPYSYTGYCALGLCGHIYNSAYGYYYCT
ncbi:unnamed protein product [Adineta steineri]|uniref:Uncharacterized protein n=1 Tax=Adineta steineri TaxID=433720 RepID=A0A815S023_9BILA|nr:unnamed protein product [Adineta steineri]CAF1145567.1 unnamed protein product [Adineta steineri]CAF1483675.1 unnamed protein product [Adineta steineri]